MAKQKFKIENITFGCLPSEKDVRNYVGVCAASAADFPEEFELEHMPIKNQGNVGSCVAHALSSIIEYYNKNQEGSYCRMSTDFIYGNRQTSVHRGTGMSVKDALTAIKRYGDVPYTLCDTNTEVPDSITYFETHATALIPDSYPNRISAYYEVRTEAAIKASLYAGNPVVFAMDWYAGYDATIKGVFVENKTNYCGGHCMYIYGWNQDGWKVANSWGTYWGKQGTFILPYEIQRFDTYAVTDEITSTKNSEEIKALNNKLNEMSVLYNQALQDYRMLANTLADTRDALQEAEAALKTATDEARLQAELIKQEAEAKIVDLTARLEEANIQINEIADERNVLVQKNTELQKKLIEIEKPYSSEFGKVIAKVINFFYKLFSKKNA